MTSQDDFVIEVDLERLRQNAEAARSLLIELRAEHDLSKWEYTRHVRIAPFEIPHSHPVLTLNSRCAVGDSRDDDAFLATYLHEQIHWALDIHRENETKQAIGRLRRTYPNAHEGLPETAANEHSTYLKSVFSLASRRKSVSRVREEVGIATVS